MKQFERKKTNFLGSFKKQVTSFFGNATFNDQVERLEKNVTLNSQRGTKLSSRSHRLMSPQSLATQMDSDLSLQQEVVSARLNTRGIQRRYFNTKIQDQVCRSQRQWNQVKAGGFEWMDTNELKIADENEENGQNQAVSSIPINADLTHQFETARSNLKFQTMQDMSMSPDYKPHDILMS